MPTIKTPEAPTKVATPAKSTAANISVIFLFPKVFGKIAVFYNLLITKRADEMQ
jgi:hypothetical protein